MATQILLTIAFIWLLLLTLAFLSLLRGMGAMRAVTTGSAPTGDGWLFDTDGPWVPSNLPTRAERAFASHGIVESTLLAVFFSSHCGNCVERAREIVGVLAEPAKTVFLLTGEDPDPVGGITNILATTGCRILRDPDAHDIVKSLDINSTPFGFTVQDGQVTGKAFIRSVADYYRLQTRMLSPATSSVAEAAKTINF